jgi:hypothetical protein
MSSLTPDQPDPGAVADAASLARCLWFNRRLLRSACRHYQAALAFAREVEASMPPEGPGEGREAWAALLLEANSAFYAAEVALAERINNLYDVLAPEGRRVGPEVVGREFKQRAVMLEGETYILTFDPADYNAGKDDVIAVVPRDHVISLDD